jgi:hypothetical protein
MMISGPYTKWMERRADGWWVCQVGGNWGTERGPYRTRLRAWFEKIMLD